METQVRRSEREQAISDLLQYRSDRANYLAGVLTAEEAESVMVELQLAHGKILEGELLTPVTTGVFVVVNGEITGHRAFNGNGEIKADSVNGVFERFDILQYTDTLGHRGTTVAISDPCIVLSEGRVLEGMGGTREIFVPLVSVHDIH